MDLKLKWKSCYSLGNNKIDNQHKELFNIANELLEISDPQHDKVKMKVVLHRLGEYVKKHFKDEEKLMQEIAYPKFEEHEKIHQEIIQEINSVIRDSHNLVELSLRLHGLINAWLMEHIIDEDLQIKEWLDSQKNNEKKGEKNEN